MNCCLNRVFRMTSNDDLKSEKLKDIYGRTGQWRINGKSTGNGLKPTMTKPPMSLAGWVSNPPPKLLQHV